MAIEAYNYDAPQTVAPTTGFSGIQPFNYGTPAPTAPPTDNSFLGIAKNTVMGLPAAATTVGKSIGNYLTGSVADQWNQGQQQIDQPFINKGEAGGGPVTAPTAAAGALSVGSGVVSKLTAPLAPLFAGIGHSIDAYTNSPYVQHIINNPEFQKFALSPAGERTSKTTENIANASNVAMGILGGIEGIKAITKGEVPLAMRHLDVQSTAETNTIPITDAAPEAAPEAPKPTHADYAKSQGYEPYTPDNQLPTIDAGKPAKSDLPTIKVEEPIKSNLGDLKVEPIKSPVQPTVTPYDYNKSPESQVFKAPVAPEMHPTASAVPKPIETPIPRAVTPEGTVTKAASDINATLVKQGMDALTPEQQSKFTEGSYKDSVVKTAQLMSDNLEATKEMARTGENIPSDIHPQILFNAIEALATKEGDVPLLQDLAKSPLGTALSESGSTLGSHGYNDNPNSAVARIREVQKAREGAVAKRGPKIKEQTISRIKESVKKTNTPKNWADFVESITC